MLKFSSAIVAIMLTTGIAYAENSRFDVDLYRGNPMLDESYAVQNQAAAYRQPNARAAFAYAPRTERAAQDNAFAVYSGGRYVGQDPDFNVRLSLKRDTEWQ